MKFSIVIPVYKIPYDYLHKCIQSAINQTYKGEYEIIIIDDESPDDCGKIAEEYAKSCDKVRVIHQKNGGLSVVRNVGFEQAQGDWVSIIDGDDYFESKALEIGSLYIDQAPKGTDVYIFDTYVEDGINSRPNYFLYKEVDGEIVFRGQQKEELVDCFFPGKKITKQKPGVDVGSTWARFYRREFIVKNNLRNVPGLRRMQDNIFNLYVIDKADTICYRCERIHHYRIWSGSAAMRYDPKNTSVYRQLYQEFLKFAEYKNTDVYRQRAYLKLMLLFSGILTNNFAHSLNPDSRSVKISKMKTYFEDPLYDNALAKFDISNQKKSHVLVWFLIKHRMYNTLLLMNYVFNKLKIIKRHG